MALAKWAVCSANFNNLSYPAAQVAQIGHTSRLAKLKEGVESASTSEDSPQALPSATTTPHTLRRTSIVGRSLKKRKKRLDWCPRKASLLKRRLSEPVDTSHNQRKERESKRINLLV